MRYDYSEFTRQKQVLCTLYKCFKKEQDYVRLGVIVKFCVESEIEINQKCSEVQEPDIRFL